MTAEFARFAILKTLSLQEYDRWLRLASEHPEVWENMRLREYVVHESAAYLIDNRPIIDSNGATQQVADIDAPPQVAESGSTTQIAKSGTQKSMKIGRPLSITVLATTIGLIVGAYTAFVAMCMWNWFVVRALNMPMISFLEMLGLIWLIGFLTGLLKTEPDDKLMWGILFTCLEASLPDDKRTIFSDTLKEMMNDSWAYALANAVPMAFGKIVVSTAFLGVGYGLHIFIE